MACTNVPEVPAYEALGTIGCKELSPGTFACGRKRPLISVISVRPERPLWKKADINIESFKIGSPNVRFAPGSGH
jgi:hypothetical protein